MRMTIVAMLLGLSPSCTTPRVVLDAPEPADAAVDVSEPPGDAGDGCADCSWAPERHATGMLEGGSVIDDTVDRTNAVLIRHPIDGGGPYPIVIWSHGGELVAGGERLAAEWGDLLASAGYVVVHVEHPPTTATVAAEVCALYGISMVDCESPEAGLVPVLRARDVAQVLAQLPSIVDFVERRTDIRVEGTRIAVGGWSAGSQAGLILAGAVRELELSHDRVAMPDPGVDAVIALSPQGPGFSGYFMTPAETSWDLVRVPVFVATGENDVKPANPDLTGAIRRQVWQSLPGTGRQCLLYSLLPVGTGGHDTYNLEDASSTDARLVALSDALGLSVSAFLDATLRDRADAVAYLTSNAPRQVAGEELAEWEVR